MFKDITLTWAGRDWTIPANRMLAAICVIEDSITIGELSQAMREQRVPAAKVATAYRSLLRFAGANVDAEDVYRAMYSADPSSLSIYDASLALINVMIPPGSGKASQDAPAIPERAKRRNRRGSAKHAP